MVLCCVGFWFLVECWRAVLTRLVFKYNYKMFNCNMNGLQRITMTSHTCRLVDRSFNSPKTTNCSTFFVMAFLLVMSFGCFFFCRFWNHIFHNKIDDGITFCIMFYDLSLYISLFSCNCRFGWRAMCTQSEEFAVVFNFNFVACVTRSWFHKQTIRIRSTVSSDTLIRLNSSEME